MLQLDTISILTHMLFIPRAAHSWGEHITCRLSNQVVFCPMAVVVAITLPLVAHLGYYSVC